MKKTDKIIISAAGGIFIAGVLAYLFATKSGKKLRKKAKKSFNAMTDEFKCAGEDTVSL